LLSKYFYLGSMFRHEKPQTGRYRQFNQVGVECIGEYSPLTDVETIVMIDHFFKSLGLSSFTIKLNSVGCLECREVYKEKLKKQIKEKLADLCDNCNNRFHKNPLRILDCKIEQCTKIKESFITITDNLCEACSEHFEMVKSYLKVPYQLDPYLVRGLDYYTKTVFEVTHKALGAQDALAAGGRYDNLVKDMGGQATGAVGFAIGMERLLLALAGEKISLKKNSPVHIYIISLGKDALNENINLLAGLRKSGIKAEMNYSNEKSLKAQMRQANKLGVDYVVIRGENEIKEKSVVVKDMEQGTEEVISRETVLEWVLNKKGESGDGKD